MKKVNNNHKAHLSLILILILILIQFNHLLAEKYKYQQKSDKSDKSAIIKSNAQACAPGTAYTYLNLNNANARINDGGDMWWDLQGTAKYEIPKGSGKTCAFAAALWLAGIDINGNLKCAAQRYRQVGVDYWTGPVTIDGSASISSDVCKQYDKFFPVTKAEVEQFIAYHNNPSAYPSYSVPDDIKNWPGNGNVALGQCFYLAPYVSADCSGAAYNWQAGDYPYYDLNNELCNIKGKIPGLGCTEQPIYNSNDIKCQSMSSVNYYNQKSNLADEVLKGDQTLWWVINDKGNVHTESGGAALGFEIRCQAFEFATNDELNDATFYSYEIINRSTYQLTQTYFSQWTDFDVGWAWDDYCGCDVERGLGYMYNGLEVDGTGQPWAYGANPPAIGVVYFQGPYMDPDGCDNPSFKGNGLLGPTFNGACDIVTLDGQTKQMTYGNGSKKYPYGSGNFIVRAASINGQNFGDGIIDNERLGMQKYTYFSNLPSASPISDPSVAIQYYNMLKGIWKDNTPMIYGGDAHYGAGAYGPTCSFMFPAMTDPCNWGTKGVPPNGPENWTEVTANNAPSDQRFMESSGPFTLEPGAINYITVGVPWARATSGGPQASVELLFTAADKCTNLFNNCFKVLDGPDAPDLVIQELNKELILYITNDQSSNNYNETYTEYDPAIVTPVAFAKQGVHFDSLYRFEGYQIYQLLDASVTVSQLQDPDYARLVAQCDIRNFRKKVTYTLNSLGDTIWSLTDNYQDPIGTLINYIYDETTGGNIPTIEVTGGNTGIVHSFDIKTDAFQSGNSRLVNNTQYYFMAIAYGYNEFMKYSDNPSDQFNPSVKKGGIQVEGTGLLGQTTPYLAGREASAGSPTGISITPTVGIPHISSPEFNGVFSNSQYGNGPKITRIEGQGNGGNIIELTKESIDTIMSGSPVKALIYKNGQSPINVKIIDPLTVVKANYILKFFQKDTILSNGTRVSSPSAHWVLINTTNSSIKPDTSVQSISNSTFTSLGYEQVFLNAGLAITIQQVKDPGDNSALDQNGYLNPTANNLKEVEYADSTQQWLTGVPNVDEDSPQHWIHSGTLTECTTPVDDSYDYTCVDGALGGSGLDDGQYFEKIDGGMWAPYRLCSEYTTADGGTVGYGPAWEDPVVMNFTDQVAPQANKLANLASVDLVLTSDQTKWSHCAVVETSDDPNLAQGKAAKFSLRADSSRDINGNFESMGTGMSWFPGYAINIETGERLNIVFGENSWLKSQNGADMKFNPTSNLTDAMGDIVWGGMHYVYVFGHNGNTSTDVPAYDQCQFIHEKLLAGDLTDKRNVWKDAMWAGIPMAVVGQQWLPPSNPVTIRFRVSKPYRRYYSVTGVGAQSPQNNDYPMYSFSTADLFTETNDIPVAKSALDLINVVPNPYYSWDAYEANQLDTRIRITNLPLKCTITIYTLSGSIVRQYKVDNSGVSSLKNSADNGTVTAPYAVTSQDWDLNNQVGIPVSSGLYLIYIDAPGIGDRVLKWFGTIKPQDVNAL